MFRTLVVNRGEYLSVRDNWLIVRTPEGEQQVPINELYSVVLDNQQASVTVPTIHRLTGEGVHLLICNEKHLPVSVILPQNTHYHPLTVIRRQIEMKDSFKDALWQRIVQAKIRNQAGVLRLCGGKEEKVARLCALADGVRGGDEENHEGIAAKMFFREMYGSEFVRMADDAVNAALNYGYAVVRAAVCKTLCAYGYNGVLGIHHISESDPFNLAEDVMEPLRPLVDLWVDDHHEDLLDELTVRQRADLAALVNGAVEMNGKKMRVRNAIDDYVCSLTTAITRGKPECLQIPVIIREDLYGEVD